MSSSPRAAPAAAPAAAAAAAAATAGELRPRRRAASKTPGTYSDAQKAPPPTKVPSKKKKKKEQPKAKVRRQTFAGTRRMLDDDEIAMALSKLKGLDPNLLILPCSTVAQFKMFLTDSVHGNMLQLRLAGTATDGNDANLRPGAQVDVNGDNPVDDISRADRVALIVNPTEDLEVDVSSVGKEAGAHWLAVLIDIPTKQALVVETLKLQQQAPNEGDDDTYDADSEDTFTAVILRELKETFESQVEPLGSSKDEYTIGDRFLGVQRDAFNCGVWCLDIVAEFARARSLAAITTDMFRRAKGTRKYGEFKDARRNFWASVVYGGQPAFVRPGRANHNHNGNGNGNVNARRASLRNAGAGYAPPGAAAASSSSAAPAAAAASSSSAAAAASSSSAAPAAASAAAATTRSTRRANKDNNNTDTNNNNSTNHSRGSKKKKKQQQQQQQKPKRIHSGPRNFVDLTE